LSKTWNVAKLTSEISSSARKISWFCACADASLVEVHAPLTIERDTPNPNAGKALLRRLRLEERFSMAQFSNLVWHVEPIAHDCTRSALPLGASDKEVRNA
jgi:hypothetical protein